jgi:hypothetical protein
VGNATVQFSGSLNTGVTPHVWTLTSGAAVPATSGGSAVSRTVSAQFEVAPGGITPTGSEAWQYVFAASTTTCTRLQNNVVVNAPLYVRGDLCLSNGARALGPKVDVKASVTIEEPSASIGSSPADGADPALRAGLGCRYTTSPPPSTTACTEANHFHLSSYTPSTPDYPKQLIDLPYWRSSAKRGRRSLARPASARCPPSRRQVW